MTRSLLLDVKHSCDFLCSKHLPWIYIHSIYTSENPKHSKPPQTKLLYSTFQNKDLDFTPPKKTHILQVQYFPLVCVSLTW